MNYYEVIKLLWDQVIIYLRKSRYDDPHQTVEEVLEKHETMLQEYAVRELGGRIPEENIYREVVSGGESIAEREAIKAVLARCEDPNIKGVLVIEPQRLSRGSLTDCDKLMTTFELTDTYVVTPMMTYDLSRKMERKFFQDELMRGRDYLEYIKEILYRGRVAAAKRGEFISKAAPYGYTRVKRDGVNTLDIVEAEADVVRQIFQWRAEECVGPSIIANRLDDMGVKPPLGKYWSKETVKKILSNQHYLGKIVYNQQKETRNMVNGEVVVKRVQQAPEDVLISEGLHDAIIDRALWDAVASQRSSASRRPVGKEVKNPYSGVLKCAGCGRSMLRRTYRKGQHIRYGCPNKNTCFASARDYVLDAAILDALEYAELPALEMKVKNNAGDSLNIRKTQLKKLEQQMAEYEAMEETQYEMLELKKYTPEVFERRHTALRKKMDECQFKIYTLNATLPEAIDYAERLANLQTVINMLKDPEATAQEQNNALKAIVERIDYTSTPFEETVQEKPGPRQQEPITLAVKLKI